MNSLNYFRNISTIYGIKKGEICMPLFVFLVFLCGILLWLLLSFAFIPLGKLAKRLWGDAKRAMNDNEENNNE